MFQTLGGLVVFGLVYWIGLIVYRLYFHPLAKFPGPKLTACSLWYEFYYDVILRGKFIWQIKKWHQQYGPIIRINPDELHIEDPEYLDEIYGSQTRPRNKMEVWNKMFGAPGSIISTVSHEHHRLRRGVINPFFSKKAVTELEDLIQAKISKLQGRLEKASRTGEVVRVDVAFSALTMDIISQYIFATDDDYLMEDDFKLEWKKCMSEAFQSTGLTRQFPWLYEVVRKIPMPLLAKILPPVYFNLNIEANVEQRARRVLQNQETEGQEKLVRQSIFHVLRDSNLPPEEKLLHRLVDEAHIITGAGSETTAQMLAYTTFHLLTHPEKLKRLRDELKTVLPKLTDTVSHVVLENLPYMNAVVAEGLRLSFGTTKRLPRIAPNETLRYKQWTIPPGTPVASTLYFTLVNPTIFPEPDKFLPERWLSDPASRASLRKYSVNFGLSTRQCLGKNLAYAEIYLTLAMVFRRFKLELYETTARDVECVYDHFVAAPGFDSLGIRVKVVGLWED